MNRWMKRSMVFGLIAVLLFVITACNRDSSKTSKGSSDNGDSATTLTFLVPNGLEMEGVEAVAADIEEKYNIKTEFEVRPEGSEGDNLVKTRLATGEMTDLMWYNSGSLFKALNPEEYFLDLAEEPFMKRIEDSFKETVSVGDSVYGIPGEASSAGGWLYNKAVYKELGLEVPKTWEQLMENNKVIKDAGKTPVLASYKDTWSSQVVFLADYYNVQSQTPDFAEKLTSNQAKFSDTPVALEGFEKLQELKDAGHYNEDPSSVTYEDAIEMLATGKAVHYPMITFALPQLASTFPDQVDDIGFFGQPGDDPNDHGITLWMPSGIYINKESEKTEAAKKWLEYFVSDEGLATYMSKMKAIGPYVIEGVEPSDDSYEAVKDMTTYLETGKIAPALEFVSPIKGPSLEQITVEVGLGMVSAKEGAKKYDRDIEKQAKQLGLEGWK